jgi:hypothetical protein
MTRDHVIRAVKEGLPFLIKMADGERYTVTDESKVAIGKTTVVVIDDDDLPHLLPLLTMTGLSYLRPSEPAT